MSNINSLERIFNIHALLPDSQRTAYHEAGHATIGRVLTLKCGRATIKPNLKEMTAGKTITFDENDCDTAWRERGKWRPEKSLLARANYCLYGWGRSRNRIFQSLRGGDGHDRNADGKS